MAKLKKDCCHKYLKKAKGCKGCPVLHALKKKDRKRLLKSIRKALKK